MTGQPEAGGQDGRDRGQAGRSGRPNQAPPGADILGDIQRWFIRSSAKNMRNQVSGQVRKSLGGGGQRTDAWDTATTEPPPQEGEPPECQWCPVCRAARRMREAGPGLGDQLSGAGDAVASAVQEAFKAFDSLLARSGGNGTGADAGAAGGRRTDAGGAGARPSGARPSGAGAAGAGPSGAGAAGAGRADVWRDAAQPGGPDDGSGHEPGDRG